MEREGSIFQRIRLQIMNVIERFSDQNVECEHDFLYLNRQLVDQMQKQVSDIIREIEQLYEEKGESVHPFITRFVDPVLQPVQSFLNHCGQNVHVHDVVCRVELCSLLQNKKELRQKIAEHLYEQTQKAVLKDLLFLQACAEKKKVKGIRKKLDRLLVNKSLGSSLADLYDWRVSLDQRRQQLLDQAEEFMVD